MSTKEKAEELVEKFKSHSMAYWCDMQGWDESSREASAVECALIHVEELEKTSEEFFGQNKELTMYLLEVKEEINKL